MGRRVDRRGGRGGSWSGGIVSVNLKRRVDFHLASFAFVAIAMVGGFLDNEGLSGWRWRVVGSDFGDCLTVHVGIGRGMIAASIGVGVGA